MLILQNEPPTPMIITATETALPNGKIVSPIAMQKSPLKPAARSMMIKNKLFSSSIGPSVIYQNIFTAEI